MADKPVTREEKYLAYLTGDYTGELPKPITRKEKYLYELCLKGIGGEISPEEIKNAVNEYLEKNPVKPGATTEQARQIEQNKTDVASLKKETGSLKEDIENKMDFELWKDIVTIGGESIIQYLNIPIEEKIKDVFVVCNKLLISGSCSFIIQTRYHGFDTSNSSITVRRGVSKDDNIMIGFETFGKIRVDKSLKNDEDSFINRISAFNSRYSVSDMYKSNIARIEIIVNNNVTFLEGCELQIYIRR